MLKNECIFHKSNSKSKNTYFRGSYKKMKT